MTPLEVDELRASHLACQHATDSAGFVVQHLQVKERARDHPEPAERKSKPRHFGDVVLTVKNQARKGTERGGAETKRRRKAPRENPRGVKASTQKGSERIKTHRRRQKPIGEETKGMCARRGAYRDAGSSAKNRTESPTSPKCHMRQVTPTRIRCRRLARSGISQCQCPPR